MEDEYNKKSDLEKLEGINIKNKEEEVRIKEIASNMEDSKKNNMNYLLREDPQIKANRELKEELRKMFIHLEKNLLIEFQKMLENFKKEYILKVKR
jgi:hypothetical protein